MTGRRLAFLSRSAGAPAAAAAARGAGEQAWRRLRRAALRWALAGVAVGGLVGLVMFAPAAWLARGVASASAGRVLLADARGTLWNGSAVTVLTGGPDSRDAMALPGRLAWSVGWAGTALDVRATQPCCLNGTLTLRVTPGLGRFGVELRPDGAAGPGAGGPGGFGGPGRPGGPPGIDGPGQPADMGPAGRGGPGVGAGGRAGAPDLRGPGTGGPPPGGFGVGPGAGGSGPGAAPPGGPWIGQWPTGLLAGLGTPWNTLQLGGSVRLASPGLALERAAGRWRMDGRADLEFARVSSRLSTLDELGSYRLAVRGGGASGPTTFDLSTLSGALRLSGSGSAGPGGVRFRGEASAEAGSEAALSNLLNIIGRRSGARSVISIG